MFGVVERGLESARDDFGLIGASIAIRVNCVEQMRWLDDECAARSSQYISRESVRHVRPTVAAPRGSGHNSRSDTDLPKLAETHRAVGRNFLWKPCRAASQIGGGGAAGTDFLRAKCERHDWIRQPMFEVKTPIAIPQNLWQDVGQNAAAKCNPRQMSGRD